MEFGPGDGALYAVDYGSNMYNANSDAALYKISYTGCLPPVTVAVKGNAPRAYVTLPAEGGRLLAPAGAHAAEVFDMAGKKLWEGALPAGSAHLTLPRLGAAMVRVLWK